MPRGTREKIPSLLIHPQQRFTVTILIQTMLSLVGLTIVTVEDLRSISNSGTVNKDVVFKMPIY